MYKHLIFSCIILIMQDNNSVNTNEKIVREDFGDCIEFRLKKQKKIYSFKESIEIEHLLINKCGCTVTIPNLFAPMITVAYQIRKMNGISLTYKGARIQMVEMNESFLVTLAPQSSYSQIIDINHEEYNYNLSPGIYEISATLDTQYIMTEMIEEWMKQGRWGSLCGECYGELFVGRLESNRIFIIVAPF